MGNADSPPLQNQQENDSHRIQNQLTRTIQLTITEEGKESRLNLVEDDTNPAIANQILATVVVAFTHMCMGIVYGFPAVMLPQLTDPTSDDIILSLSETAYFGSLVFLGTLLGTCVMVHFLVQLGPKIIILLGLPVVLVAWLMLAFSPSVQVLLAARFLLGISNGFLIHTSLLYITEIASKNIRGRLIGGYTLARDVGYLLVYIVGSFNINWRILGFVFSGMSIFPFICLLFLPNSPSWLVTRDRMSEARKSIAFFRGHLYNSELELENIKKNVEDMSGVGMNFLQQLLTILKSSSVKIFFVLAFLSFLIEFCGVLPMFTNSVSIFQAAEISLNPYYSAIIFAGARVVGSAVNLGVVDSLGRRPLLITSFALSSICLAALGGYFYSLKFVNDGSVNWLPLPISMLYIFLNAAGQPVLNLLQGELLPASSRATGVTVLRSLYILGAFASLQLYPYITNGLGEHWTFWIFSAACATMALTGAATLPETRGRSLEEINTKN